jgi:diacylglycerol kinase family enzyme
VLVVVNGAAGAAGRAAVDRAVRVLQAGGSQVEVAATTSAEGLARALDDLRGRRLVVVGGDGSLHAVVRHLHATGALEEAGPVGIVPLGTGNDLARSLGLPLGDPAAAARVVLDGRALGNELVVETSGSRPAMVAVNAAHAGIGVSAALRAQRMKPRLGRLAYPLGAVAAGAVGGPWHLRVAVDGQVVHDGVEPVALVGLSIGRTIGGGAHLSPASTPHDGLVDVVVSTSAGLRARAAYAATMLRGRAVERYDVARVRGRDVVVQAVDGEPFAVNADGELTAPATRFAWTTLHDAWSALVPAR